MKRAYVAGQKIDGRVRVVFVVELDERSTNVDADWSVSSSGVHVAHRSGEQALAALVEVMEARNG
jgi:hypothetical protein